MHAQPIRTRLLTLAAMLLVAGGVLAVQLLSVQSAPDANPVPPQSPSETHTGLPIRLKIPKIKIDAPVQAVGLLRDGTMDIPSQSDVAGWFAPGTVPGHTGNAVMAGHLDTFAGTPGIFWELRRLKPGDRADVQDASGHSIQFKVIRSQNYSTDAVPMQEIFGETDGTHLNLITCGGTWNRSVKSYDKRLVVYMEKVEEE